MNGKSIKQNSNGELRDILAGEQLPMSITFKIPEPGDVVCAADPKFRSAQVEYTDTSLVKRSGGEYKRELLLYLEQVRPVSTTFLSPLVSNVFLYVLFRHLKLMNCELRSDILLNRFLYVLFCFSSHEL